MDVINLVVSVFSALVGFPAFLAALINLLKFLGVLGDNSANILNFWANIVVFAVVAYFIFTGQTDVVSWADTALGGAAKILVDILVILGGGLTSMAMTRQYHNGLKGLPVVGASHSVGFRPLLKRK